MDFVKKNLKECFAVVVFLAAYAPILIWMWDRWNAADSYYSHGILIPFVSGYLIYQNWNEIKDTPRKESPLGIVFIVLGLLVYLAGTAVRVYFISGFSMFIVFLGLILFFFGTAVLKKIIFPIFFLTFMLPMPLVMITNISFKLKMMAAEIATGMLNDMRIPAIRMGSIIKMPHAHVTVDDVCSGLRSLISLTALGSIFAYWMKGAMWKKVLLFLMTIPIAIVTNVFRVLTLAMISEIWGAKYASGFVHDVTGYMVFVLAFLLLYGAGKVIE